MVDNETEISVMVEPSMPSLASPASSENEFDANADSPPLSPSISPSPSPFPSFSEADGEGLKILFLSSDTGGGHRASSESLANQFQILFPGSTYILHDVIDDEKSPINYFPLVKSYRHLSAHPTQWKILYEVTNSRAFEMIADANMKLMCERNTRKRIMSLDPDVVISVHPMMTNVPQLSCAKILNQTGKHIPIFTVVTDLGSGHCLWFANGMEKMFVGSDQIWDLAKQRGNVPDEKLVKVGLPIRHDFAVQAEKLGDRTSKEGRTYQRSIRKQLELPPDRHTLLVMGGGEGVGSLSDIVNSLYGELAMNGIDACILVVCGRNEKLQNSLAERDWEQVRIAHSSMKTTPSRVCNPISSTGVGAGCIQGGVTSSLRKILSSSSLGASLTSPTAMTEEPPEEKKDEHVHIAVTELMDEEFTASLDTETQVPLKAPSVSTTYSFDSIPGSKPLGKVEVKGLGFITNMAEYMVAADILVSKAGPGTISEAAALSLPVMLTSFLPGQEEGNVDFVLEANFGTFCSDRDPAGIAEECVMWLSDELKMQEMSANAKAKGAPHAARDIAMAIGDSTLKWKEINQENGKASIAEILKQREETK